MKIITNDGEKDLGPARARGGTHRQRRLLAGDLQRLLDKLEPMSKTESNRYLKGVKNARQHLDS